MEDSRTLWLASPKGEPATIQSDFETGSAWSVENNVAIADRPNAPGNKAAILTEGSDSAIRRRFYAPSNEGRISFEYMFVRPGSDDRLVVSVDGQEVWRSAATVESTRGFVSVGPLGVATPSRLREALVEFRLKSVEPFTGEGQASIGLDNIQFDGLPARTAFVNLSTRARSEPGENTLIVGFVVQSASPRPLLVRAVGPTLARFGVVGAIPDPMLVLYSAGGQELMRNDDWADSTTVATNSARLGAFSLGAGSRDAAAYPALDAGRYSAVVSADRGAGQALMEVYDGGTDGAAVLTNISTRAFVTPASSLIAGFVVAGNAPKKVLIRAVGPGLRPFGIANAAVNPVLRVFSGSTEIARNDDWFRGLGANELAAVADSVGAFRLAADGNDAALLLSLDPGAYTAVVDVMGASGVVLVEAYDVP